MPAALAALVHASAGGAAERAWEKFLAEYSTVIAHAIRSTSQDADTRMDRYVFVLDALTRDDYRRLRAFSTDGRGAFTTWLVAVVRRLCIDEHRSRYGRPQAEGGAWVESRRQLADLVSDALGLEQLEGSEPAPDALLLRRETTEVLRRALATLAPSDRLILRLRFEDNLSVPEIARLLNRGSPFKLYRDIERMLAALRSELEAVGVRSPAQ